MELQKYKRTEIQTESFKCYLNGASRRNLVGEVAGVEVALQATDREDKLCALDFLLDFGAADGSNVDLGT